MNDFNDEIDNIIERVSYVEETIEFLSREIKKYGKNEEVKARIIREFSELRKLSDELNAFCDKYGIEWDEDEDEQEG